MFTGIVEEKGIVREINKTAQLAIEMIIEAKVIIEDMKIGDSISVNGVCLTVTNFTTNTFSVDVMPETIKYTSLAKLENDILVNLERAMQLSDRFGGHIVSGHVDGTGIITKKVQNENAIEYFIEVPEHLQPYFIKKGSVTIDGISLTVFEVLDKAIKISIIPHTASTTTIGIKEVGDVVNIECDILLKHVQHLISASTDLEKNSEN